MKIPPLDKSEIRVTIKETVRGRDNMKLGILFAILMVLVPATVSADNWWDNPPPPPNAGNAEDWPFDTYYFEPTVYKNVDSGPSWQEVQIQQMEIEPEPYWQYT